MTFLQPWLLLALPLVALPVIIHLINQQRFQSVEWAAMMFLLSAKALARGTSKLRHWLIMLLRILAVAAAILAVSRPASQPQARSGSVPTSGPTTGTCRMVPGRPSVRRLRRCRSRCG